MANDNGNHYAEQSRAFLTQAFEELARDDLRQASEKGWGAAAQIVKAAAEERRMEHGGHGMLFNVVRRLRRETGEESLGSQFQIANGLHFNFYEGWYGREDVTEGLEQVSQFVDRVETLLNGHSGAS